MKKTNIVKIDSSIKELIPTFIENRQNDILKIGKALSLSDLKTIETIAHKIAGNAGSYGLDELGLLGKKLEKHCQDKSVDSVLAIYEEIKDYLKSLEIEFI